MTKSAIRVLVAEDEEFSRLLLMEALDDAGFEILEARDGYEALRLMDDPDGVEIVVSDINMPGCDGFAVVKRLREIHPGVPVILVTGRPDQLLSGAVAQPVRSFHKPFKLAAIVEAVQDMLASRARGDTRP